MTFSYLVTAFFQNYLAAECGLSPNTIASYSDCIRLLINFICTRLDMQPEDISIDTLNRELIIDFLDDLQTTRKNTPSTRNQRLASIKTFFHFLARHVPEHMHLNETIQAIRQKRTDHTPPPSMTIDEVNAIIAAADASQLIGARDKALVTLMYNTGARVQELADLAITDIRFDTPATVKLTGKGNKTRIIPLRDDTVKTITHYLDMRKQAAIQSDHLFLNIKHQPLTRFGIGRRIGILAETAAENCPSLRERRITPHVFRHAVALHLIESNVDIVVVKEWLGHADLRTTSQYLEVSIERKRAALEKVPPPTNDPPEENATWRQPQLMAFLIKLSRNVMLRQGQYEAPTSLRKRLFSRICGCSRPPETSLKRLIWCRG
jgi:site-specific recombinase XerD